VRQAADLRVAADEIALPFQILSDQRFKVRHANLAVV
jgi:hypothetical protein